MKMLLHVNEKFTMGKILFLNRPYCQFLGVSPGMNQTRLSKLTNINIRVLVPILEYIRILGNSMQKSNVSNIIRTFKLTFLYYNTRGNKTKRKQSKLSLS